MTDLEYEAAMERIDKIFDADPASPEGQELELLVQAVMAYEGKHYPIPEPTPEAIAEFRREQEALPYELGDVFEKMAEALWNRDATDGNRWHDLSPTHQAMKENEMEFIYNFLAKKGMIVNTTVPQSEEHDHSPEKP